MKAAVVRGLGQKPVYSDFSDVTVQPGFSKVTVTASALSNLTKGRASGSHYSSSGGFPFVAGADGVGRLENGKRVYFALPEAPFGGMAEQTLVESSRCIEIPEGLDDVTAAALANPGMSSWAAFCERAKLVKGETVLINGATGASGSVAVQIAKHLGAKKVIATGRNPEMLEALRKLGADVVISLNQEPDALEAAFCEQFAGEGINVVLDYLWGVSAERLLIAGAKTGKEAVPIRFVQIGTSSGPNINLPGAVLRSSSIELMGSGIGSVPLKRLIHSIAAVFAATRETQFKVETEVVPLAKVADAWDTKTNARIVFVPL